MNTYAYSVCMYYAYAHTISLDCFVSTGNKWHFCMYTNCATNGYPRLYWQDINTIQYLFFRVCHGLLTSR